MINSRTTVAKVQTLTKSEYALAKHIPNAIPLKRLLPESDGISEPLVPTPKMDVQRAPRSVSVERVENLRHSGEQVRRAGQRTGPSENEEYLGDQLRQCNQRTAAQEEEINYLRVEIKKLQDERMLIVQQYEQKLSGLHGQESSKFELERRLRILESERASFEDEINRLRMRNTSLEVELEELRRHNRNNGDANSRIEDLVGEINYYESQLKQAKAIQINLEQELRQRADERAKMISEYELRITNLQNDIALFRSMKEGDSMRQSQTFGKMQEENSYLVNENKSLRTAKRDLEVQIDRLRSEKINVDETTRGRYLEIEAANRNNLALIEKLKAKSEASDIDRVLLMTEIDRLQEELKRANMRSYEVSPDRAHDDHSERVKRAGASKRDQEENAKLSQEKATLEGVIIELQNRVAELENKNILFMIEIERLGIIVGELQVENELWRQQVVEAEENSAQQIAEFKRQYELIIRPQIESEIRNATGKLESEKTTLDIQIQSFKSKQSDYENRINYLQSDLAKLQEKNLELSRQLEEWRLKYSQLERGSESLKYSLEGELRLKWEKEKSDLNARWAQDRAQYEADLARYKERVSEIETKAILLGTENDHLNHVIRDKDSEIEVLRNRLLEAGQEQRKQLDQLREQLEITFKQRLEIELRSRASQLEAARDSLESELRSAQNRIAYLEDQLNSLNTENQRLRQEIVQKSKTIEEYNVKITLLDDRNREIDAWKQRYDQLQNNHNNEVRQLEAYYDDMLKSRVEKELREFESRAASERHTLEIELRSIVAQRDELEGKLVLLGTEIDRLQGLLTQMARERDDLRMREHDLQLEMDRVKISVESQIRQTIEREIVEISMKFTQERNELESYIIKLKAQNQDLLVKHILYMAEIERLHTIIFENEREEDNWRERVNEIENHHANQLQEHKKQAENNLRDRLKIEITQITHQFSDEKKSLENELNFLKGRNKELQDSFTYITEENSRLRNELNAKESELEQLRQKLNALRLEQERYADELRITVQTQLRGDFEAQMKDLTGRFNTERIAFEDQIRQLKNRIAEMEHQLRQAQEHHENLDYHLKDHQNELETLKRGHVELEKRSAAQLAEVAEKHEREKRFHVEDALRMLASQHDTNRLSLESKIRILEQKDQEYQQNLSLLSVELERMSKVNLDLKTELDNLRVKNSSLERRSQVELDQLKIQLEAQYRAEKENLTRELHNRFSMEVQNYEGQIRELRQKIIEYESNMMLLSTEVQRLSAIIADKQNEIEVWKGKITSIERIKEQELQEMRQRFEFEQRTIIERELRNLSDQFGLERAQYDARNKEMRQKLIEYENKFTYLTVEIDRLNALYEDKIKEIESWKQRYQSLEKTNYAEFEEVRLQMESIKRNSLQMSDFEIRFQAERTSYEAQIMQYKHKIAELEAIVIDATKESQRMTGLYHEKSSELELLKKRGSSEAYGLDDFEKLLKENEKLKKEVIENQELRLRFEVEKSNYQNQTLQLKQVIEASQIEMTKLYDLLETRKRENEGLYRDLNKAREDATKKFREFKEIESEHLMATSRYKNVNKEIQDLQNARDLYRSQLEKNEVELTVKNKELLEKIHQIDALKDKYEEAIANVDPIASTIITRYSTTTRHDLV